MTSVLLVVACWLAFNAFLLVAVIVADLVTHRSTDRLDRIWQLPTAPDRSPECDWRALEAASRALEALPVVEPPRWPS